MTFAIILAFLLVLNIVFGVKDYQRGKVTKHAAFSWFVIGWVSFHLIVVELPTLL